MKKTIIIGAGPAGLAAADTLCRKNVPVILLEKDGQVGGLSRTIRYKKYSFDIGPHRFYSRNKAVLDWWNGLLKKDFLHQARCTRIYYRKKYFDYPLSIRNVLGNLGILISIPIFLSYLKSRVRPHPQEKSFEQWTTNRFGRKLYLIFFKNYTEKLWGIPCDRISADWAGQRIKGLSFWVALRDAVWRKKGGGPKTLITGFYYPRLGSGMMYQSAAERVIRNGGRISLSAEVLQVRHAGGRITGVLCRDHARGGDVEITGEQFCSSMPITSLVSRMSPPAPERVLQACKRLTYRGLVMVYLVIDRKDIFRDHWIYVHDSDVKVARIQNFKNWSLDMLGDRGMTSLGMEYFCNEGDAFWSQSDADLAALGSRELCALGLAREEDVRDAFVLRVPKAYPVYQTDYADALDEIKRFVKGFSNLHCIGRNGMFCYSSMDHQALTGFAAARNILGAREDIWSVDEDYICYEETANAAVST